MTRATGLIAAWFCLLASLSLLQGQQTPLPPPPVVAPATGDAQPPPAPDATPAPSGPVDPKTGLPLTPAEIREREIDQFDPMKRSVDPAAQQANPLTDREPPPDAGPSTAKPEPLPGSLAAETAALDSGQSGAKSGQSSSQDAVTDSSDTNGGAEYTGPAVLSRSYTLARPMIPHQVRWVASVGFSYSWDDGKTPTDVDGTTELQTTTTEGRSLDWTVVGRHVWKHDQIGLSYAGSGSEFGTGSLSGWNNTINLDYAHVVSRRLTFQFVESAQDLSQNYSLQNPVLEPGVSIANVNLATSPSVQLLNSTTRQSSSQASMTFHKTSRLSFNFSSSYFVTGRSQGVGVTGTQFGNDVNYRWTRKVTVGAYYSHTSYQYSHNISTSDSDGAGLIYSYAFNSTTQLQTRLGMTRVESLAYETVPLPPLLAALLGQAATVINAYSQQSVFDVSVQLVRDFRRGRTASLSYAHGESPGNGVLLTSVQQTVSAGYAMSLFRRRVPLSIGVVYSSLSSSAQGNLGNNSSKSGHLSTSRPLGHGVTSTLGVFYSSYSLTGSGTGAGTALQSHDIRISFGITWSPPTNLLPF